jgi:hypothetical protein
VRSSIELTKLRVQFARDRLEELEEELFRLRVEEQVLEVLRRRAREI